jgi:Sulfotransferase domain
VAPKALIASYPGSGHAWVRLMLASYLTNAQVAASDTLDACIPDLHSLVDLGRLLPADNGRPQIVNTHFLPGVEVLEPYQSLTTKVVYLVRNPRDVLMTAARILGIKGPQAREFARDFIANRGVPFFREMSGGTWPQNVLEWTSPTIIRQHFPSVEVLAVRFEDMTAAPADKLRHVLEFLDLGETIDFERVARAVANSPLEGMQEAMDASDLRGGRSRLGDRPHDRPLHLGEDIEAAYRRLLRDDEQFSGCAKRFRYVT